MRTPVVARMILSFLLASSSSTTTSTCRAAFITAANARGILARRSIISRTFEFEYARLARQRRRVHKSAHSTATGATAANGDTSTLDWETFDFSVTPKSDLRFHHGRDVTMDLSDQNDFDKLMEEDHAADAKLQRELEERSRAMAEMDDGTLRRATEALLPYISERRWERIASIIGRRTQRTRFVFEHPSNPSNVFACLRTLDSFGIQHADVIVQQDVLAPEESERHKPESQAKKITGKAMILQKRGMRTAMGSAKWMTIANHLDGTRAALERLKAQGYVIVCTDVNSSSKDIRDMDWSKLLSSEEGADGARSDKKLCIVMGNEECGISDDVREVCDASVYLPMSGFAESFNLSVATAIVCAHLSAAATGNGDDAGPLRPGDLDERERTELLFRGAVHSVSRRMVLALFKRQKGLEQLGDSRVLSKLL